MGLVWVPAFNIRARAEELSEERGELPAGSEKHAMWGGGLAVHTKPWVRARSRQEYWQAIQPAIGRPYCAAMSRSNRWGVTKGDEELKQKVESTTKEEVDKLVKMQMEKKSGSAEPCK